NHQEHVGEIRFVTRLNGAWNFLAGSYAENLQDKAHFDNLWYGNPATNFFGPNPSLGDRSDRRGLVQKAEFGEVSWEFLKGVTLTGGVRHYQYDRTFVVDTTGPVYGGATHVDQDTDASGQTFQG